MEAPLSKHTVTFGLSLVVTSLVNALVVVVKEKNESLMTSMKQVTGHQWTTHAAFIVVLFGIVAWSLGRINGGQGPAVTSPRLIRMIVACISIATIIIVGFYCVAD